MESMTPRITLLIIPVPNLFFCLFICSIDQVLPLSIARWTTFHSSPSTPKSTPFVATAVVVSLFGLSGIVNSVLFVGTRPGLLGFAARKQIRGSHANGCQEAGHGGQDASEEGHGDQEPTARPLSGKTSNVILNDGDVGPSSGMKPREITDETPSHQNGEPEDHRTSSLGFGRRMSPNHQLQHFPANAANRLLFPAPVVLRPSSGDSASTVGSARLVRGGS